jgi:hypothetical protein
MVALPNLGDGAGVDTRDAYQRGRAGLGPGTYGNGFELGRLRRALGRRGARLRGAG